MTVGIRRGLWLVAVAALVTVAWPAPAFAHNQLIDSDPADGAQLETGPEAVELTFLASLDPEAAELSVTGPDGGSVVAGAAEVDGTSITVVLQALPAGAYEITYEVLSNDGHTVSGTLGFTVTVGESTPTPSPAPAATPAPTTAAVDPTPAAGGGSSAEPGGGAPGWVWPLVAVVALAGAGGGYGVYRVTRGRRRAAQ